MDQDSYFAQHSIGFANKVVEVVDDVIKALLEALANKSTPAQKEILACFADYVAKGGELKTCYVDKQHYEAFENAAVDADMTYYAVSFPDGRIGIILMQQDVLKLEDVERQLAAEGRPLVDNPQIPYDDFYKMHAKEGIEKAEVGDPGELQAAKYELAQAGVKFAVTVDGDGKQTLHYSAKDKDVFAEAGLIKDGSKAMENDSSNKRGQGRTGRSM